MSLSAEARSALIVAHLGLVRSLARKALHRLPPSFEFDDLVQDGVLGLYDALDKWQPDRGVTFGAYARLRVWGAIVQRSRRSHYRNATMQDLGAEEVDHILDRIAVHPALDERIHYRECLAQAATAAEKLPAPQREVFCRYYCGESTAAIAARLQLSETRISQLRAEAEREVRHRCRRRVGATR